MPIPNPVAFNIFGLDIMWYGILIAFGVMVGLFIAYKRAPKYHLDPNAVLDITIIAIPCGIIGARLYYILFTLDSDIYNSFFDLINTRAGGLAIHGGLIGAFLAGYFVCKKKKISFLNVLDLMIPSIALAQAIGRWGNYFNSEAHGGSTDLPWAVTVMGEKVHPTFLYESIWCLILFFLLSYILKRRKFTGQVACLYGILYSIERFLVEGLRTDSLMIGMLKQAQILSLATIIICGFLYFYLNKKNKGENK